jgi:predicted ATPase
MVAAAVSVADRLLRGCPSLRIVATSREPLGVDGEVVWRARSLSEVDAVHLFHRARHAVVMACSSLTGVAVQMAADLEWVPPYRVTRDPRP